MKLWSSGSEETKKGQGPYFGQKTPRILNFFDLIGIGVGSTLAIGISVLIGDVIKNWTGPGVLVSAFAAGVTALVGGLCFSEFGVRFLKADSAYAYSYSCNRENSAFIYGWALILEYIAGSASVAKGTVIFIDVLTNYQISNLLGSTNSPEIFQYFDYISLALVVTFFILISLGIKKPINIYKSYTVCSLFLIISIIVSGALKANLENWEVEEEENKSYDFAPFGILRILKGAAIMFYGFIGFDTISVSGFDIKSRKRILPLTILMTILITLMAQMGIGAVLTLMLPYTKLIPHAAVPFAFEEIKWFTFKWFIVVVTSFGFLTSLFGATFALPNIISGMANDGLLFRCLASNRSNLKTPIMAKFVGGILAALAAGGLPFQKLVNLTVLVALFVYTILAINVVLLRYSPKTDNFDKISESWKGLINLKSDVSAKAIIKNFFNFREKHPTDLTKKIIQGNLILFCVSSVCLSVIINYLNSSIIIPSVIISCIILLNLISMSCQPKSQEKIPFRVPLVPLVPCLSIFLNIFLMISLESITWILFLVWMAAGIIPHFLWSFIKFCRGQKSKNSLYDINRTNALMLNESLWKIKLDRKSFYEGTINLAFSGEFENKPNNTRIDEVVNKQHEKPILEIKQAEIVQTAGIVPEEKVQPLQDDLEPNFIRVGSQEIVHQLAEEDEKVQWECVAEIHTEEFFPQVFETVDTNYSFLTEGDEQSTDIENAKDFFIKEDLVDESVKSEKMDQSLQTNNNVNLESQTRNQDLFKEELLIEIERRMNNRNTNLTSENKSIDNSDSKSMKVEENSNNKLKKHESDFQEAKPLDANNYDIVNFIMETFYETHSGEMLTKETETKGEEPKSPKPFPEEQNKIKDFKEKLNQLLKNQINHANALNTNSLVKSDNTEECEEDNKKTKQSEFDNIKTLNKSQIKGKLELLLAKGPPKRPALSNSFNIKIKENDSGGKNETTENDVLSNQNNNDEVVKPLTTFQESIKEKILSLKNVNKEMPNDAYC